jgi:hypothetical protein
MAKSTPHFNDMVSARGGMGQSAQAPGGGKKPPMPKATKAMPKKGMAPPPANPGW